MEPPKEVSGDVSEEDFEADFEADSEEESEADSEEDSGKGSKEVMPVYSEVDAAEASGVGSGEEACKCGSRGAFETEPIEARPPAGPASSDTEVLWV